MNIERPVAYNRIVEECLASSIPGWTRILRYIAPHPTGEGAPTLPGWKRSQEIFTSICLGPAASLLAMWLWALDCLESPAVEISAYRDIERLALSRLMSQSDGFEHQGKDPKTGKSIVCVLIQPTCRPATNLVDPNASLPKSAVIHWMRAIN